VSLAGYRERRAVRRGEPTGVVIPPTPPVVFPAVLRGTRVVQETLLEDEWGKVYGRELLVAVADHSQHPGMFVSQIPAIAGAFGTVDAGVQVFASDTNTLVKVRIVTAWWLARQEADRQSCLREIHYWPGPTLDPATGRFQFSVLTDRTPGFGRLWIPDEADPHLTQGARPWWFTGRTRGGKTGSMAAAILSAVTEGVVYPCVIDMQDGVSLGEWMDRGVPFAGNITDAHTLARRVLLEGQARTAWMKDKDNNGFGRLLKAWPTPTPELPIILLVVDEAPALAEDKDTMWVLAKIMRELAKAGIAVWWATQMHQTMQAFGYVGGDAARNQMKAGSISQFSSSVGARTEAFDVADGEDMSSVQELPRGIAGANLHVGPDHEQPVLGRALYEPNIDAALDRWARIPDYELVELPAEVSPDVVADPTRASSCEEAVSVIAASHGQGAVIATSGVLELLAPRWKDRTVYDALSAAVASGVLVDAGRGEWRVL